MAHLFDMNPPMLWLASLPMPFSSENPPSVVRASCSTNVTIFITDNSVLLVILGALP
jgi:hypothetical protein